MVDSQFVVVVKIISSCQNAQGIPGEIERCDAGVKDGEDVGEVAETIKKIKTE